MSTTYTFDETTLEYKRLFSKTHVPKRAYQSPAGYEL